MATCAEGLATRVAFELPQQILWEQLDDFVLVSEDENSSEPSSSCSRRTRNLAEPAGAAPLAAALQLRDRLAGKRVALILSGGNISPDQLREILARSRVVSTPCRGSSGSTTSRSRSATSSRRWSGTGGSSSSRSSASHASRTWPSSDGRPVHRALAGPLAAARHDRHFGLVVDDKQAARAALEAAGAEIVPGRGLDFIDPWGNHLQVVDYGDIQFSKTPEVLRGMGLDLPKSERALAELRESGLA